MKPTYQKIIIPTLSLILTSCGGGSGGESSTPTAYNPGVTRNNSSQSDNTANSLTHSTVDNHLTHNINSSGSVSLNSSMTYIDDEHVVKDIGVIDTSYYLSDSFKDANGNQRLKIHNQSHDLDSIANSHGTSVVAVINRYNTTATIHAYNTYRSYHDTKKDFLVDLTHYDIAYNKGIRIFNNSYGSIATENFRPVSPGYNITEYAKKDSIFVWASGNEKQKHGTPDSVYPVIDDNARNGWISVAEADYDQNIKSATEPKDYGNGKASNYIGEKAKTWGIATQGTYQFLLKDQNAQKNSSYHNVPATGTSFATPRVTATAANVWTKFPWMDHHLVIVSILSTADKPGTFIKGQDGVCNEPAFGCGEQTTDPEPKLGWGLLNERRALKGPALFDKRLLTNKDAKLLTNDEVEQNSNISGQNNYKDLLVVNFDFRNYTDKEKLTWSNDIKGDAGILKQGSGTLYLTGKNAYQGKTIVDGGVLAIGHSLTSPVIIKPNGTLLTEFDTQKYHNSASKVTLG